MDSLTIGKGCPKSNVFFPSCVVSKIRRRYPTEYGKYTGFKSSSRNRFFLSWGDGIGTYSLLLVVLFSKHNSFNYIVAFNQFYFNFNLTICLKETSNSCNGLYKKIKKQIPLILHYPDNISQYISIIVKGLIISPPGWHFKS